VSRYDEDRGSHTEADAGAFERARGRDYGDDAPSASDLAADEHPAYPRDPGPTFRCRAGCGGRLWTRGARDEHEGRCSGTPPW
jgi:hypothetical protein